MTNFEEKLEKLEKLSENIKQSDISLEDALKNFEEGIKLAKTLEKELDKMEGKIQILMNGEETKDGKVERNNRNNRNTFIKWQNKKESVYSMLKLLEKLQPEKSLTVPTQ